MPILNSINQMQDQMTEWRQDLHKIPEIGLQEFETSKYIKNKLSEFNIKFKDGYANTGVVAWVDGNEVTNDKTIGLRADFDALPMPEQNEFNHKSQNKGMMHGCGHDGHTTMLLGAAKYLAETKNFKGRVVLIFQPAEEGFAGAKAMIKDGLLQKYPIDEIYGMHNMPGLEKGVLAIESGPRLAAADNFEIEIVGKGAHGAMPSNSIDPGQTESWTIAKSSFITPSNSCDAYISRVTINVVGQGTYQLSGAFTGTIFTFTPLCIYIDIKWSIINAIKIRKI